MPTGFSSAGWSITRKIATDSPRGASFRLSERSMLAKGARCGLNAADNDADATETRTLPLS
ncbi:MAG TPA: hypothetical protein VET30_08820, partial [Pseudoxanthomonas sp.]|nr:hypothetical protein [Pseudoxanthomonas sp.]